MKRNARPAARPAPPTGWQCARHQQRINWWNADKVESRDWAMLGVVFGWTFGILSVLCALALYLGDRFTPAALGMALAIVTLVAGVLGYGMAAMKTVFRFEFDVGAGQMALHETQFPNRERIVIVPFSDVTFLQPRKLSGWRPNLNVRYHAHGAWHERWLGYELDEAALEASLASLKPVMGDKVLPMLECDG